MALPPAIDLEMSGYNRGRTQAVPEFQRELTIFTKMVAKHYDKTPVIYTTRDFERQFLKGYRVDRLWIREVVFWPSRDWNFWQFTPRARLRGVSGAVDLNAFNGDASEFEAFIGRKADVPGEEKRPPHAGVRKNNRGGFELLNAIVQRGEQLRNRLFGFVAHVGEAKVWPLILP